MAPPTWSVGQVLTAADVLANNWFVPIASYRTSTQTITSNQTLANDNQLSAAVAANAVYDVKLTYRYNAATAGDFQFDFTLPAGATNVNNYLHEIISTTTGLSTDDAITASATNPSAGGLGTGTDTAAMWTSILTTGGSSGTLQPRVAQLTSFATSTSVLAASSLILQRIG